MSDVTKEAEELVNAALTESEAGDPPFFVEAEFANDNGAAEAAQLAAKFGLRFIKSGPNGNPVVKGRLATRIQVNAFANYYGGKASFEPREGGLGTDVYLE